MHNTHTHKQNMMMNLPLELQPLGIEKPKEKKKNEQAAKVIKFNDTLIKQNFVFLNYIAYAASDCQVLDALFEVEPEQLAAVRNLASNLIKANKNFVTEFVQNDTEQNRGKRPYKFARQGKNIKKVTIRHPVSPTISTKMTPSMLRRVEILKEFLQKLFIEKARRAAIQSKARFLKAVIKGGLELYESQKKSEALENEKGRTSSNSTPKSEDGKQRNEKEGGGDGRKKKEKSKEKNRKRPIEGLRRDDRKTTKEEQEWDSDSAEGEEENDDGWFHNRITLSTRQPERKKTRHAESSTNLAAIKRVKKAKREESEEESDLSDYSSNNNSSGEEESFEDGEERGD